MNKKLPDNNLMAVKRKRSKKSKLDVPVLPEEVIFNILILLPAKTLYNKMRYVCKQWYNIIRDPFFINQHLQLQQSRTCLLVKFMRYESKSSAVIMEKKEKKKGYGFGVERIMFRKKVAVHKTSCDGLILISTSEGCIVDTLYVLNPVTKQHARLPRIGVHCEFRLIKSRAGGDYKVVSGSYKYIKKLMIITVGKSNAWRCVNISTETFLSSDYQQTLTAEMIGVGGFVHWVDHLHVITLDGDSESLSRSPVPEELKDGNYCFRTTGNFLSLLTEQPDCNGLIWHVWRFTDCKKGGGGGVPPWTKLYNLKFKPRQTIWLYPIGWVDNGDVLILSCSKYFNTVVYNVKTGEVARVFKNSERDLLRRMDDLSVHVNSLVPPPSGI